MNGRKPVKLQKESPAGFAGGGRCHNLKNGKKASELREESPAGCAGEGNAVVVDVTTFKIVITVTRL